MQILTRRDSIQIWPDRRISTRFPLIEYLKSEGASTFLQPGYLFIANGSTNTQPSRNPVQSPNIQQKLKITQKIKKKQLRHM